MPVGITCVVGHFNVGDVVSIMDECKVEFAKGNPNFSSGELNLIKGLPGNGSAKEAWLR